MTSGTGTFAHRLPIRKRNFLTINPSRISCSLTSVDVGLLRKVVADAALLSGSHRTTSLIGSVGEHVSVVPIEDAIDRRLKMIVDLIDRLQPRN